MNQSLKQELSILPVSKKILNILAGHTISDCKEIIHTVNTTMAYMHRNKHPNFDVSASDIDNQISAREDFIKRELSYSGIS